ncbi:MAG: FHA domain-containing protein [Chloroflexi bacterium]|nr:FHA domain-containing protein [Chloroflexota bacterium]
MPEYQLVVTVPPGQTRVYPVAKEHLTIGRASANDILVSDHGVSRAHARLHRVDDGFEIEDLDSMNGTWLMGKPVKRAPWRVGQTVIISNSTLRLRVATAQPPDEPRFQTVGELSAALASSALEVELPDLTLARLVIHTPTYTKELTLTGEATTIGRESDAHVILEDERVANQHALIVREGDRFIIKDLATHTGTWLAGQRIEQHELRPGDSLRIGNATLVYKAALGEDTLEMLQRRRVRNPIVFVPGFMGSELWHGSERIWPNVTRLFTNPELYRWPSKEPIEARQVVSEIVILPKFIKLERYAALGDFLCEDLGYERGKDLLEFPWDWRMDLRVSAQHLSERITEWRERVKEAREPITLISHSMGCLIARYFVERLNGRSVVSRMIMMGGTHNGMPKTLQPFSAFGKQPFYLGIAEPFERAIASLPSIYTMLPTYPVVFDSQGKTIDLYRDETWCQEQYRANLRDALAFRNELGTTSSVSSICIFGYGIQTPTRAILEERDASGNWERIRFVAESKGDNTVPEESARLAHTEIHPVHQHHGNLYADNDVKARLTLELTR